MESLFGFFKETFRFQLHGVVNFSAAILNLSLGSIVWAARPKSWLNRSFFLVTLTAFIWLFGFAMMSLVEEASHSIFWLRVGYFGVPYIPLAITFYSLIQLQQTEKYQSFLLSGLVLSFIFNIVMAIWAEQICSIQSFSWGRYNMAQTSPGAIFYFMGLLLHFSVFLGFTMWNLVRSFAAGLSPTHKQQLKIIILAFLISYTSSVDFLVTFGLCPYPFGYISVTLFTLLFFLSILRHQYLEINFAANKGALVLFIYLGLFALLLPIFSKLFQLHFFDFSTAQNLTLILTTLLFGLVLSLGPLIYSFLVHRTFWLKGIFSRGLSHELKSPINTIQSVVDLLIETPQKKMTAEKVREYMTIIQSNADRLETFSNSLLRVAHNQEGEVFLKKEKLDLRQILSNQIEAHTLQAQKKGLRFSARTDISSPFWGDREKIEQVISNLIGNAIKYSDSGTIRLTLTQKDHSLLFKIQDQGTGLPPAHLKKIFNRFFQGPNASKGAGLGLAIAKGWVEAHGGKIWAESEGEGKGTTVLFALPFG